MANTELNVSALNEGEEISINDGQIEEMFKAGVHFGYSRSRRHPKMSSYIYGIKNNVEFFDLEKVKMALLAASDFIKKIGESRRNVLWVGTKPSIRNIVSQVAKDVSSPYVAERWLGGTLTNAKVIRERLKYFEDLKKKQSSGELEKYTKKEQLEISREISALDRRLGGIESLKNEIAAMVIVDPKEESTALNEALKMKLPVIAIMSSDSDPSKITYPIPANDSSPSSVALILKSLAGSYRKGVASSISSVE